MVFVNFPFLGQESFDAAEAATCAQDQGKFWEYHAALFESNKGENAGSFSRDNLNKLAQQVGLDMTQFGQCVDSHKYRDFVLASVNEAKRAGVRSTPTLFVNGRPVEGFLPFDKSVQDQTVPIAPGAPITNAERIKVGAQICLSGQADDKRRLAKGEISDPPGDDQKLCGVVKSYTPASADKAGEMILTEEVPGLKQMIEAELQKKK